ncbi:unnamed protein product [Caenorhabditis nigoni]
MYRLEPLIGTGTKKKNIDSINKCVNQAFNEVAATGKYAQEVFDTARDEIANVADCDTPLSCVQKVLTGLIASEFASDFDDRFNGCLADVGGLFG